VILLFAFCILCQIVVYSEQTANNDIAVDVEDPYSGGKMMGGKMMGGKMMGGKMGKMAKPKPKHQPHKPKHQPHKPKHTPKMGKQATGAGKAQHGSTGVAQPKAKPAPAPVTASSCSYTVKSGDTLSGIGGKLHVSWQTLASENHIASPYVIHPGQVLHYSCGSSGGGGGGGGDDDGKRRDKLVECGRALYNNRGSEHYTEGSMRWQGITDKIRPPHAPTYSDCSSAVSWCYWTVFGDGPDILNGDSWKGGYTGTMASHGHEISCSDMKAGDVTLFGSGAPWDHAEMYMGSGQMVSHGMDPVSMPSSSGTQGFATKQCRRYF